MEKKMYCPICGEELICDGYNYESGHTDYHCEGCDKYFNESQVLDEEESKQAELVYDALEAAEEQGYVTPYSSRLEIDDVLYEILLFKFSEEEIDALDDKVIEAALLGYLK